MRELEDTVANRDPEAIMREIEVARDQLALTVDSLADRANPHRLADDLKSRAIERVKVGKDLAIGQVKKYAVPASLAGVGVLVVAVVVRRIRNR